MAATGRRPLPSGKDGGRQEPEVGLAHNKGVVMGRLPLAPLRGFLTAYLLLLLLTGVASAASPIAAVNTENGWAIKGYDPVAYFTTGKPTPGIAQFTTTYQGDLSLRVGREPCPLHRGAGEIRAAVRRLLRLCDRAEPDRRHRPGRVGDRQR
jgi:hypothetical protein